MSELDEIRDKEIEYCQKHLIYFVENYGHIEDHEKPDLIQPFKLWQAQKDALIAMRDHKWTMFLKARQLGISWLVLHFDAHMLMTPGRTAIGLSRSEDEAAELVRRTAVIFQNMPELTAEKGNIPPGWTGKWFENNSLVLRVHTPGKPDSILQCFPSNESAARSFTADLLIFDEWAFQQFDRQIWASALPTINRPNSGKVVGVSTIKRGSLFEELWTSENPFYKMFIPWYANPARTKKWYEETKALLGDEMHAEYPATQEEALTVPGGAFFPEVTDSSILTDEPLRGPLTTYFAMDYGLDMFAGYWVNVDADGNMQIVAEHCEPNLTIGACAQTIIDLSADYHIEQYLAPPDLWNRDQVTGKSRAYIFQENGVTLTKVSNDFAAGCAAMKEMLRHPDGGQGKLTILRNCAPVLLNSLKKIQHDEKKANVYAKEPHNLTHSCDGIRYLCVYWVSAPERENREKTHKWTSDMWEDYENASPDDQKYLIGKWGRPE